METMKNLLVGTAGVIIIAWGIVGAAQTATALTLRGYYFKVANGNPPADPDFHNSSSYIDGATVTGLVQSTLGPNGLPVVSTKGKTYTGKSGPITDTNSNGEILWWRPTSRVSYERTGDDTSFSGFASGFFPQGETTNSNFFRTVHWSGTLTFSSTTSTYFKLGADDDAFLFIDGTLVVDNGGIKANSPAVTQSSTYSANSSHNIDLFFADRDVTQSGITFDVTDSSGNKTDTKVSVSARSTSIPFELSPGLGILMLGTLGAAAQFKSKVQKWKLSRKNI